MYLVFHLPFKCICSFCPHLIWQTISEVKIRVFQENKLSICQQYSKRSLSFPMQSSTSVSAAQTPLTDWTVWHENCSTQQRLPLTRQGHQPACCTQRTAVGHLPLLHNVTSFQPLPQTLDINYLHLVHALANTFGFISVQCDFFPLMLRFCPICNLAFWGTPLPSHSNPQVSLWSFELDASLTHSLSASW